LLDVSIVPFDKVDKDETVYIVDFSLETEDMTEMLMITEDIIWIDHHKTAIDKYSDYPVEIKGLRRDGTAGCELVCEYFNREAPMYVKYIGDRDVWKYDYGVMTNYFNLVLMLKGLPEIDSDYKWAELNMIANDSEMLEMQGKMLQKFQEKISEKAVRSWSYEADFEDHRILCLNSTHRSSDVMGENFDKYPFIAVYTHNGEAFSVSLYSKDIDVSKIAVKFGGGGHANACGFMVDVLPWTKVK